MIDYTGESTADAMLYWLREHYPKMLADYVKKED